MVAALLLAGPGGMSSIALGQTWQPTRVSSAHPAQQLDQRPTAANATQTVRRIAAAETQSHSAHGPSEQLGSGVVLRWKSTASRSPQATQVSSVTAQNAFEQSPQAAAFEQAALQPTSSPATSQPLAGATSRRGNNPLRSGGGVRPVAYQQLDDVYQDPFGDDPPTTLPGFLPDNLPQLPGNNAPATESLPSFQDPLAEPELPPDPSALQLQPPNPFGRNGRGAQDASPRDRDAPEPIVPRELGEEPDELDELSAQRSSRASCNEQRERIRNLPLSNIDLDVSPTFGEGLRSVKRDMEQERLDFAAAAQVRNWSDYRGQVVATGRLIDLRDDRVILDVNGTERAIPFRDLSDVDVAYVGKSWNIPPKCGIGYEQFIGRNFIASTVQWKASGASHKPLYFEEIQLERYGHEAGPVLQPLVSTVHFFGNIAVLPYKMGIHPPHECQYSLGYFRPGNCAPYMLQPIPWSLRGALTQAGAVTGAAALIP